MYSYMYVFFVTLCITYMQVTQQVYIAEEWVRNSHDQIKAETHSCLEVEKTLEALKEEHAQLSKKLKDSDKAQLSAEAGLKTMERQMEDQHQKLHITEINLATKKQIVLNLKAELQKAKETTRVAKEATEAVVSAFYDRGVADTKTCLAEEVVVVCKDYVTESWGVAMDQVGALADSQLRKLENIFFLEDIREILNMVPPTKELLTTQAPLPDGEVSKGAGVDEEAQPLTKAKPFEDALTIRDVVLQTKDAELKSQVDPKDPPLAKT